MSRWRRAAPVVFGALAIMGLLQGWLMQRAAAPTFPAVAPHPLPQGAACLREDAVLAALAARGVQALPEAAPFCALPEGLVRWYALTPVGPDGTHLAFDPNGCLQQWSRCPE